MYINVRLLKGFSGILTYKIPADAPPIAIGSIVTVPIRTQIKPAVVLAIHHSAPENQSFVIKELLTLETIPYADYYQPFLTKLSSYYQIDSVHFTKRITQFISQKELPSDATAEPSASCTTEIITLTDEQQCVVTFMNPQIEKQQYTPVLLHGVTGSGKTEVYKKLILQAHQQGKTTILLLPEVTLAVNFELLLKSQLINISIFGFHSATSVKDKKKLWVSLCAGTPVLIIGVHLPIFLPISNLGLIIIDEEHEIGFQEKKHPKINSKEAALIRAQLANIPIILGSATPSISSLYNVKMKGWHFFQLKKRFSGSFPTIITVPLNDKKKRKNFWISKKLELAIIDRLSKSEQTIIFLNRRGYSFFVQCKQCSFIFECTHCSVSLTLHEHNMLHCHYCGQTTTQPTTCPSCKTDQSFLKKGIGTQQVVEILQKLFPTARIGRADMDSTVNKKQWQETIRSMHDGSLDILVGTQTITKGYHFPKVTLVGILWADLNLHFPIFNAAETTLQQLIQVAGRAGRNSAESLVVIQTMLDHPIFAYVDEINYLAFYHSHIEQRITIGYPPYNRLVEIELKHNDEQLLDKEADLLASLLNDQSKNSLVLGPAKPPIHKIKNSYSRKIYLKDSEMTPLITLFSAIDKKKFKSSLFFTPNPLNL
jgi:primosomal protein N' (replication factor Y)